MFPRADFWEQEWFSASSRLRDLTTEELWDNKAIYHASCRRGAVHIGMLGGAENRIKKAQTVSSKGSRKRGHPSCQVNDVPLYVKSPMCRSTVSAFKHEM